MKGRKIDRLCRSVLPPGYDRMTRLAPVVQRFLEENLPPPTNRAVTLLKADDDEIVIAAFNPMVANYLRLHSAEIAQQLRESLGLEARVRFRTLPESMLRTARREPRPEPRAASESSIDAVRRGAESVDDEQLRAALLSLARSMKPD
jgi:hypothetical protein